MAEESEGTNTGENDRVARDGFAAIAVLLLAVVFIAVVIIQIV